MCRADFKYFENQEINLNINFPYLDSIEELAHRIICDEQLHLKPYAEIDFINALENFIHTENANVSDTLSNEYLRETQECNNDEDIIRFWEKLFKEETVLLETEAVPPTVNCFPLLITN